MNPDKNKNRWQKYLIKSLEKQLKEHKGGSVIQINIGVLDVEGIIEVLKDSTN